MSKNFLRIEDLVTFSLVDPTLIKVKDDYEGAFKLVEPGQTHPSGMGTVHDPGQQSNPLQSGLQIRIAATHAGIITRNNGFYLPDKMKKGLPSFTDNYSKPILLHHEDHKDPVGRVVAAQYIDTSGVIKDKYNGMIVKDRFGKEVGTITDQLLKDFISGHMPFALQVDTIRTLLKDSVLEDTDYEGLGYGQIVANIVDPLAIQKLLDGRYLTGSVGATTDKAVCSVCRQDWTDSGACDHKPGGIYDGVKCFIIAGNLSYDEYSFVNMPADRHSKVLELHYNGVTDSINIENDYKGRIYEVQLGFPQYDSVQSKEENTVKTEDILPVEGNVDIKDSLETPEGQVTDAVPEGDQESVQSSTEETSVEDSATEEELEEENVEPEETFNEFITRILAADSISKEDEYDAYSFVLDAMEVKDSQTDWDKISEEMEKFVAELEEDDEELQVEDADKPQDKPGGSNVGKYKKGPFCGPAGGAPKGSYPVNTKKRAKAALAYARHAPNPSGIRKCVCRHWSSLPSCGSKSKDMYSKSVQDAMFTGEQFDKLPASSFCGPGRTFPVTDAAHYIAVKTLFDDYKGEADISVIVNKLERKAKAFGYTSNAPLTVAESIDDNVQEDIKTPAVQDSGQHTRVLRALLEVFTEDEYASDPVLDDEDKKVLRLLAKKLANLVGKDSLSEALVCEDLAVAPSCYEAVLAEVDKNEEMLGSLRDQLKKTKEQLNDVRKEYASLYSDLETLQDGLVTEKESARKTKESHLSTLMTLKDHSETANNFSELSDEMLEDKIKQLTEEVDMTKIIDKLGDGMSREPTEDVDDTVTVRDDKTQKRELSVQELQKIEEEYTRLLFLDSIQAERYRAAEIRRLQLEGKLPQNEDE